MAIGSILTMNIILTMNGIAILPRFCHWDCRCDVGTYVTACGFKSLNGRTHKLANFLERVTIGKKGRF